MKKSIFLFLIVILFNLCSCHTGINHSQTKTNNVNTDSYPELDTMVWRGAEPSDKILFVKAKRFYDTVELYIKGGFPKSMNNQQAQIEYQRLVDSSQFYEDRMKGQDSIIFNNYVRERLIEACKWAVDHVEVTHMTVQ